jgi:hypothetical protein
MTMPSGEAQDRPRKRRRVGRPRNAQHEPDPPFDDGVDYVRMSIRSLELVAHLARPRCSREAPHGIDECGLFDPPRPAYSLTPQER